MPDISSITPPTPPQTVTPASPQAGSGAGAGTPASSLPAGTVLSGTIAGKDASGNYLLRTAQGTVAIRSSTPLTYNSDVVVRVDSSPNGATTTRILSVNGEAFSSYSAPEAPSAPDVVSPALLQQGQALASAGDAQSAPAAALRAVIVSAPTSNNAPALANGTPVVIRPTPAAPQVESAPQALAPGTTNTVAQGTAALLPSAVQQSAAPETVEETPANVAQLVTPQPAALTQDTPQAATTAEALAPEAPAAAPSSAAAPASVQYAAYAKQAPATAQTPAPVTSSPSAATTATSVPAASTLATATEAAPTATAQATAAPAASIPQQTAAPASANLVQAQVVNANANGVVSLQTPLGNVTVKIDLPESAPPLLPGNTVSIELPANILTTAAAPATTSELAASWTTLSDIVDVLKATNAPAATALLAQLPQLGPEFAATTLPFLANYMSADIRKLLGDDAVNTLTQNGRADLLEKFSAEVQTLGQSMLQPTESATPRWQMFLMPFAYQEALQQARLYVKREPPKKEPRGKKTDDTRFVLEVDMSELGPVQMDGLIRKHDKNTAFDLVIRTATPFSSEQKKDINVIYDSAAQLTGFKGSLAFQVTRDFPVKPQSEMMQGHRNVLA